jgi:hypothetical protein
VTSTIRLLSTHAAAATALLAAVLCAAPGRAEAATFAVAKTGSDGNPCTEALPCKSLSRGVSFLAPGDTLVVHAGVYTDLLSNRPAGGGASWAEAMTIAGAPGEEVVIKPGSGNPVYFSGASTRYIVLSGLVLDAGSGGYFNTVVLEKGANHIRFVDSEIRNGVAGCIKLGASDGGYHEFIRVRVHGCGSPTGGSGFNIYSGSNVIDHAVVYDNFGTNIVTQGTSGGNVIRFSEAYGSVTGYGIDLTGGIGNIAHNNILRDNARSGLRIGWATGVAALQNTIRSNGEYGISNISSSSGASIINNICYDNVLGDLMDTGVGTIRKANLPAP